MVVDDVRVSWAVGTADVSAFGARLGGRVEEGAAAVAVSPHALDGLLEDELLLRRPRGLGDLRRYFSALSATTLMGASSLSIFFGLVLSLVVSTAAAGFAASFDDEAAAAVAELYNGLVYFTEKATGTIAITLTFRQLVQVSLLRPGKVASGQRSNSTFRSPS